MTNKTDAFQEIVLPSVALLTTLKPEIAVDQRLAELKATSRLMSATFYTVPQELLPFVHQPTHCVLDHFHANTDIPTDVFLSPENFFQLKKTGLSGFGKRLELQLSLLKTMPEPKKLKADSLSDGRLGKAILRRRKGMAEICKLIIAQEKRFEAKRNSGYDA